MNRWLAVATACALAALAGCGPCDESYEREAAAPPPAAPPAATAPAATATPTPTPTATAEAARSTGELAVGITEQNPNLIWPEGARAVPEPFARWRDVLARMRPAYYRLVLDWPSLEQRPGRLVLDAFNAGCLRDKPPCAPYGGVRDQLRALAARQREGGWAALVVIAGTPEWAARPPSGCERSDAMPRSRPPRSGDGLAAYRRLIERVLAEARAAGAELRYWSPWNEPNHPAFLSPQRARCDASAPSAAVPAYVELARAMKAALDAAPGEQELVLGEIAALDERKPRNASISEFASALPDDLVCSTRVWGQHGYVGGRDPVDDAERGLRRHGCEPPRLWITETGVGAPRSGEQRATSRAAQDQACGRLHRRLRRWYADDRVLAAFQYTFREDDLFPTGLVTTDLSRAFPALGEWMAWGRRAQPTDPPPGNSCGA